MKTFLMTFILTVSLSIVAHAQGDEDYLRNGYTSEGIYYEVFGEQINPNIKGIISVERQIIYNGKITPTSTLEWKEEIDGVSYSGTLKLVFYTYNTTQNTTIAWYSGTLAN